jgi:hypothetical protein
MVSCLREEVQVVVCLCRDANRLSNRFADRPGDRFQTARDYSAVHSNDLTIEDVSPWLSERAGRGLGQDQSGNG